MPDYRRRQGYMVSLLKGSRKILPVLIPALIIAFSQQASAESSAESTVPSNSMIPAYETLLSGPGAQDNDSYEVPLLKKNKPEVTPGVVPNVLEEPLSEAPVKNRDEVFLDADSVTYGEKTGLATATGNVKVRNKETRLFAPYAEYDANTNIVDAFSDHREDVTIITDGQRFTGKHLTYNMETRRGIMTQVSGKSEAMYMQGGTVKLMPVEDAVKQGIISAPRRKKNQSQQEDVAQWIGVTSTTCDFTNPHYSLVSKNVIIYPGKRTVLKRPKFYIGKTLIMTYPFDYIITQKKQKDTIFPIFRYDSDKGMGFGLRGPIDLGEYGQLDLAGVWWTNDIVEAKFRYEYEITNGLTLFGDTKRLYNKDLEDTIWRPSWGLNYSNNGWSAKLWWAQRELVTTEMKPGITHDHNVWRDPEFQLYTPWFKDGVTGGKFRAFGIWGRYQDNSGTNAQWYDRSAYGAEYDGQPSWSLGFLKPFYGARYTYFDYTNADRTQDVTDLWFGFNYKIGTFDFNSYFFRRWAHDGSPMSWDDYSENKVLYQTIGFPLPIGASWEKWYFSVTGAYSFAINEYDDNELSSLRYTLTYDKHCMTWQLWYLDNRADEETKIGLTFFINAYPEYKLELGSDSMASDNKDSF